MPDENLMPHRSLIGFNDRQFHVFPDEITYFLKQCDKMGLHNVDQIIAQLELIKSIILSEINHVSEKKINAELIDELMLAMKATIYESGVGG